MWSDPEDISVDWKESSRGAGYVFGASSVQKFNQANGLSCVLRAHQLVFEGYRYMFDERLCTVWSVPNYCYDCGNVGAILEVDEKLTRTFKKFEAARNVTPSGKKISLPTYFL